MGQDTCKCSHKFVTINLQNLAQKTIIKSEELNFIVKNGQNDKSNEGIPNFPDDEDEHNPDHYCDLNHDEENDVNLQADDDKDKVRDKL